jgi:hypothetical protein
MHQPIQDGLEDYLAGRADPNRLKGFHAHLAECADCRELVTAFRLQSQMIQTLRPPVLNSEASWDPQPGFYARVLERIDSQSGAGSIWSLFLEPVFGKRLAFATMALFILLASVAYTTNNPGPVMAGTATPEGILAVHDLEYPPAPGVDIQHDRDVVLTHLASFGGSDYDDQAPRMIPVRAE